MNEGFLLKNDEEKESKIFHLLLVVLYNEPDFSLK